jgi:hypothetical protein
LRAQEPADPREQLDEHERLGEVLVRSGGQTAGLLDGSVSRPEHQHR